MFREIIRRELAEAQWDDAMYRVRLLDPVGIEWERIEPEEEDDPR